MSLFRNQEPKNIFLKELNFFKLVKECGSEFHNLGPRNRLKYFLKAPMLFRQHFTTELSNIKLP